MATQQCPRCKLLRSPGVRLCECGWDFAKLDGGVGAESPSGIRGWLILPLVNLVVALILSAFSLLVIVATAAGAMDSRAHSMRLLWFEGLGTAALLVSEVFLLYLFLKKRSIVPMLMMIWLLASAVFMFADVVLASTIPGVETAALASMRRHLIRGVFACVIWIPYFLRSDRVAATFVR